MLVSVVTAFSVRVEPVVTVEKTKHLQEKDWAGKLVVQTLTQLAVLFPEEQRETSNDLVFPGYSYFLQSKESWRPSTAGAPLAQPQADLGTRRFHSPSSQTEPVYRLSEGLGRNGS